MKKIHRKPPLICPGLVQLRKGFKEGLKTGEGGELYLVGLITGLGKISVFTEKSYIAVLAKVLFEFTRSFEI